MIALAVITGLALAGAFALAAISLREVRAAGLRTEEALRAIIADHERIGVSREVYVEALQNRLMSHSWETFAGLQNSVIGPTQRHVEALQHLHDAATVTPPRPEHAFGENGQDMLASILANRGVDLEGEDVMRGPTIG